MTMIEVSGITFGFSKPPPIFDDFNLQVVHHRAKIGHYILTFRSSGKPLGKINYDRKLKLQDPQQTVSACIIARDAEHTLGETLRKIEPIVDEIIVNGIKIARQEAFKTMNMVYDAMKMGKLWLIK